MTSYQDFQILRTGFNIGCKLKVTDNKKVDIPSYVRGQTVKFNKFLGNTVSVSFKNGNLYVPIQAVIAYEDKVILSTPRFDDLIFAVIAKNEYFKIGTVFTATLNLCGSSLVFYDENNTRIILDSDWAVALSSVANKEKVNSLASKFQPLLNIPIEVAKVEPVPVVHTPIVVEELETDKLLPQDSIFAYASSDVAEKFPMFEESVNNLLSIQDGTYVDISGKSHDTLLACLKRNQYFIDNACLQAVVATTQELLGD